MENAYDRRRIQNDAVQQCQDQGEYQTSRGNHTASLIYVLSYRSRSAVRPAEPELLGEVFFIEEVHERQ